MHERIDLGQITLVSYGSQFLLGRMPLEEWYRHGALHGGRFQFRALDDNALLADNFTLWLGMLQRQGALRLSLHLPHALPLCVLAARSDGDAVIAAHFADRYQYWLTADEYPLWLKHPQFPNDSRHYPVFPDAAAYGGELASYWLALEVPGQLDVPVTDWSRFAEDIRADLEIKTADPDKSEHAYFPPAYSSSDGSLRLPVFPYSSTMTLPHLLMKVLSAQRDQFSNDTNCKNENSIYNSSVEEQKRIDAWGRRLEAWSVEAALRCANELGDIGTTRPWRGALKHRYHWSDEPSADTNDSGVPALAPVQAAPASPEAPTESPSRSMSMVVFAVILAVACLTILAFAHILVRFPWLVILFGLPFALYAVHKK